MGLAVEAVDLIAAELGVDLRQREIVPAAEALEPDLEARPGASRVSRGAEQGVELAEAAPAGMAEASGAESVRIEELLRIPFSMASSRSFKGSTEQRSMIVRTGLVTGMPSWTTQSSSGRLRVRWRREVAAGLDAVGTVTSMAWQAT